jgi:Amt family ammonium transporter
MMMRSMIVRSTTLLLAACAAVGMYCPEAFAQAAVDAPAAVAANPAGGVPHLAGTYDTGSIAWMMVSTALVFFMMPGLALFYGGMVRAKNLLNMFMLVMICVPLIAVEWVAYGYNMAFAVPSAIAVDAGKGPDGKDLPKHSYLGWDPGLVFMRSFAEISVDGPNAYERIVTSGDTVEAAPNGVPELMFAIYQMMFAIITPALIVGAVAERVKFSAWCLFTVLWATIVYNPVCHWVWNVNGWLFQKGVLDFAGGTVVHVLAGVSALALLLILPKRHGYPSAQFVPHSVGWTLIGAALLMVGWFGFNAGSAIAVGKDFLPVAGPVAVLAFATTAIAGSAAAGAWALAEGVRFGKPTALGLASGMVAGLVAITPCAGHVSPLSAVIIGILGGLVCFAAVQMKSVIGYDDSLDVVGVHGVGGALGALLVGVFSMRPVMGGVGQLMIQLQGLLWAGTYAFICTWILGKLIDRTIGFTVGRDVEAQGLDIVEHGESAYHLT